MSDEERKHLEYLAEVMFLKQDPVEMRQFAINAYEFASRPFKVVLRVMTEGRPQPGAVAFYGARTASEQDSTIKAAIGATWATYANDPDIALEVIVLNQDFQRERYFIKSIQDCAPSS